MKEEARSPWQRAIQGQDEGEIERLLGLDRSLAHQLVVYTRGNGTTYSVSPIVASRSSLAITQLLVEAGADVNTRDVEGGATPLSGSSYEVGVYLIERGASIDAFGYENLTPLAYATYDKNLALVQFLIKRGAQVNRAHEAEGITPLHYAARRCDLELIRTLLSAGADPAIPNAREETPLDWALAEGRDAEVIAALRRTRD